MKINCEYSLGYWLYEKFCINTGHPSLRVKDLKEMQLEHEQWPSKTPYTKVVNKIRSAFNTSMDEVVSSVAIRSKPVNELVETVVIELDKLVNDMKSTHSKMLDEFNVWLVQLRLNESNPKKL